MHQHTPPSPPPLQPPPGEPWHRRSGLEDAFGAATTQPPGRVERRHGSLPISPHHAVDLSAQLLMGGPGPRSDLVGTFQRKRPARESVLAFRWFAEASLL